MTAKLRRRFRVKSPISAIPPRTIGARSLVLLLSLALCSLNFAAPPPSPNFIIILADDLGYADLGCYGHPNIRTPQLDRMAAEGMRFTQCYVAACVCTPSRAALLTGRYPIRSGMARVLFPHSTGGLPANEITLATALKSAGYATACFGKWHLGCTPDFLPTRHGFDEYFGIPYSNDMSPTTNPGHKLFTNAPPTPLMRGTNVIEHEPDQRRLTRRYTDEALRFIRKHAGRESFLLYLPHTMPHYPLAAGKRFAGKSPRGLYGDVVEELDSSTGEILAELHRRGIDNDTLVIFTSDNGPWLEKKLDGGSAGLLREGKASNWEGGQRIPFIARWPGHIPTNTTTTAFVTLMDLFPTLLKLAKVPLPNRELDGSDISPVLLRNEPGREPLLAYYSMEEVRAFRKGPWKLHVKSTSPGSGAWRPVKHEPPLLFHLDHDPGERFDIASEHPDVVADLQREIARHIAQIKPGEVQK